MQLFEVIRWGNESDDPVTGGADGPDTCFLVRAPSLEAAVAAVDRELVILRRYSTTDNGALLPAWANTVYLLGTDDAAAAAAPTEDTSQGSSRRTKQVQPAAQILRGPYVQHAYRYGWRHWYRDAPDAPWVERPADGDA